MVGRFGEADNLFQDFLSEAYVGSNQADHAAIRESDSAEIGEDSRIQQPTLKGAHSCVTNVAVRRKRDPFIGEHGKRHASRV